MNAEQIEMVSIEQLVSINHTYRRLKTLLDFPLIIRATKAKESHLGAVGFGVRRLIMCLILQFMEDLSDREFERFISENVASKWFCGFGLLEKTPDFTTICKFRKSIGTKRMGNLFHEVKRQMQSKNYCSEVFTFVDSSALVSKLSLGKNGTRLLQPVMRSLTTKFYPKFQRIRKRKSAPKATRSFGMGSKSIRR